MKRLAGQILVIGKSGQLGQALQSKHRAFEEHGYQLLVMGRPQIDFTMPQSIEGAIVSLKPAIVINAAAYTNVDEAESQPPQLKPLNETGPGVLAKVCADAGIPLIHISSDYVFDGYLGRPYNERNTTAPINRYGESKLAGENAVMREGGPSMVLRTSWLYSPYAKNFMMSMLAIACARDGGAEVKIVKDQRGCPTSAEDLAYAIADIVKHIDGGWQSEYQGIFHLVGGGDATWFELAETIFASAARLGWTSPKLTPITTAERKAAAKRPQDSRLDSTKAEATFAITMPLWRVTLERTIIELNRRSRMPIPKKTGPVMKRGVMSSYTGGQ